MVHFKYNLKKFYMFFVFFTTLQFVLTKPFDLDTCKRELGDLLGLKTPPLECVKKVIKDLWLKESVENTPLVQYIQPFKVNRVNYGNILPISDFCIKRVMSTEDYENNLLLFIVSVLYFRSNNNTENIINNETEDEITKQVEESFDQCMDQIQIFGKSKKEIFENALNYHIIADKHAGSSQYSGDKYFIHQPGSYGEAYLNHITDSIALVFETNEDPEHFCDSINEQYEEYDEWKNKKNIQ